MGHKGTFVEELRLLSSDGRCEGSPQPAWAPRHVQSPSPQPREPCSSSGPPCSRALPGCGIRGQIRQRFTLATQMSWIGKWGWGEKMDPAVPEGGGSLGLGAAEGVGAAKGILGLQLRGRGPARGGQGASARRLVRVCLEFAWFPPSFPLPQALTRVCSRRPPCSCLPHCPAATSTMGASWVPAFQTNGHQHYFAGAGTCTKLLDSNSSGRAEIWV